MVEYTLKSPIVLGKDTVEVLKLEEPTVAKLESANVNLSEDALSKVKGMSALVYACSTNVTTAHIGKMKLSDLVGAVEACTGFFG